MVTPNMEVLTRYADSVFEAFYDDMLSKPYFKRFFSSREQIEQIVIKQKENLIKTVGATDEVLSENFERLGIFHHDLGMPLVDLIEGLDFLEDNFYETIPKEELDRDFILHMHSYFKKARQLLSKGYFSRECGAIIQRYEEELNAMLYYRVHVTWVINLVRYFANEKNSKIPLSDYENRIFSQLLNTSEFEMILQDEEKRKLLDDANEYMTQLAKSILYHIRQYKYHEAYTILQTFTTTSQRVMFLLNRKILDHYNSREEGFFDYLHSMLDKGNYGHLTVMNIKKLGLINKYRGTDSGDKVIREIEDRLKSFFVALDENVVFVRAGNGEFYIYYGSEMPEDELHSIQSHLKSFIENEAITINDADILVNLLMATIHLCKQIPDNLLERLLHYALARGKEVNNEIYYITEEEVEHALGLIHKAKENIHFVQDALLKKNMEIFLQPIFDLNSGELFDVEVLARIKSDERYISAGEFISLIHELDIVVELDIQILNKIIEHLDKIMQVTPVVFVNVSPSSLRSLNYVDVMVNTYQKAREKGARIYFELTEQSFLDNIEIITQISENHGLKFAVDDFGTGFSSLRSVAELAEKRVIEFIKIDGSIVKHILDSNETYQILDATSYMTKKLNLKNVAEFIENDEILEKVKELGIDYGQGYHFSKPLHLDELLEKYAKGEEK